MNTWARPMNSLLQLPALMLFTKMSANISLQPTEYKMKIKTNTNGECVAIGAYAVHPLANMVPMASPEEQVALKDDIQKNGQLHPVTLYRGKIVDGRCRTLACLDLSIQPTTKNLSNNMTLNEVGTYVKSENTRRNLNTAQKAIIAAKAVEANPKIKGKDACNIWGIKANEFYSGKYILANRADYAAALFKGNAVPIKDGRKSRSPQVVAAYLKAGAHTLMATPISANFDSEKYAIDASMNIDAKDTYDQMFQQIGGFGLGLYTEASVAAVFKEAAIKLNP